MNRVQTITAGVTSPNPLVRKLLHYSELSQDAVSALEEIQKTPTRMRSGVRIEPLGQSKSLSFVVQSGCVINYTQLEDGRRQIRSFAIPGDIVARYPAKSDTVEWVSETVTRTEITHLKFPTAMDMATLHPALGHALEADMRREAAFLSNQILRLGRLTALERVAHLIFELYERNATVGLTEDSTMPFPFTQSVIADALGLSLVHVNRQMSKLRNDGVIALSKKRLTVTDPDALIQISQTGSASESAAA